MRKPAPQTAPGLISPSLEVFTVKEGQSPGHKHIAYSLPYLYGVGKKLARVICDRAGIPPTKKTEELTENDIKKIRELLETEYKVEGDLRREIQMNIKRLMDLGCYRGSVTVRGFGARAAYAHQRAYPQGTAEGNDALARSQAHPVI